MLKKVSSICIPEEVDRGKVNAVFIRKLNIHVFHYYSTPKLNPGPHVVVAHTGPLNQISDNLFTFIKNIENVSNLQKYFIIFLYNLKIYGKLNRYKKNPKCLKIHWKNVGFGFIMLNYVVTKTFLLSSQPTDDKKDRRLDIFCAQDITCQIGRKTGRGQSLSYLMVLISI